VIVALVIATELSFEQPHSVAVLTSSPFDVLQFSNASAPPPAVVEFQRRAAAALEDHPRVEAFAAEARERDRLDDLRPALSLGDRFAVAEQP
jgi:hypothetical protein